jgi:hypothetical protein
MSSSSGGATGITAEYIRDAQDVTRQLKRRLTYLNFKQGGDGAPRYTTDNGNESYLSFLFGKKESCATCIGLPFQLRDVRLFR